jgi:magnesium transporter
MVKFYITENKRTIEIPAQVSGCWINLENPTEVEIDDISKTTGIDKPVLMAALDEDEIAHLDTDENLILLDIPKIEEDDEIINTRPLALISTAKYVVTVCAWHTKILEDFTENRIKNTDTTIKNKFMYQIIANCFSRFIFYLQKIDRQSEQIQESMEKSQKNQEIIHLLELQKTVVYFSASLSANYSVMQKVQLNAVKAKVDEAELLDDILLDARQAIEMSRIYRETIKTTMDAFGTVVNNNQNIIMKFLAAVTIILSIPMVVASFWGMNTGVPFETHLWGFYVAVGLSVVITAVATVIMAIKKMF